VGEVALGLDLHTGSRGGVLLPVVLLVMGAALGVGYSPVVTHALAQVPLADAADASGLLTTTIQLGQVIGVAVFGSLFLTLASQPGRASGAAAAGALPAAPHAIAATSAWLAGLFVVSALAAIPLTRTVAAGRGRAVVPGCGSAGTPRGTRPS
jgi:hypothetical protein